MTEFTHLVDEQRALLEKEARDSNVTMLELRFENGKLVQTATKFANGKVVIEYADKRKKNVIKDGSY